MQHYMYKEGVGAVEATGANSKKKLEEQGYVDLLPTLEKKREAMAEAKAKEEAAKEKLDDMSKKDLVAYAKKELKIEVSEDLKKAEIIALALPVEVAKQAAESEKAK